MTNFSFALFGLALLFAFACFVSALVYASNNSNANLSKLSCNIKETVNEFVFKGAAVKDLGGVVVTHVIYLNANQNDFLKATVLRHVLPLVAR